MAKQFNRGETVKCNRNVKNPTTGEYYDPTTSMTITITNNQNGIEVDDQDMVKDATGKYHYNWLSSPTGDKGIHIILYKATDGADIAIEKDTFILE